MVAMCYTLITPAALLAGKPAVRNIKMPLYEYICLDCRTQFDALRPIKEADQSIACPDCQGMNTSRMLSLFYAHSDGRTITQSAPACSACSSHTCSTCGVN
jgi:putative FmdB family regulatory protein